MHIAPAESAGPSAPPAATADLRRLCAFLRLPLLCGNAACRRARACRGAPRACIARRAPLVPEAARAYAAGLAALKESGLPFEDEHWRLWEEERAYKEWVRAVESACASARHGARPAHAPAQPRMAAPLSLRLKRNLRHAQ